MLADRVRMGSGKEKIGFYIYDYGKELSDFSILGTGNLTKNPSNLLIFYDNTSGGSSNNFSIVSDEPILVTPYTKLKIKWSHQRVSGTSSQVRLMLGSDKTTKIFVNDFIITSNLFLTKVDECDIASYTGFMYPHINLYCSVGANAEIIVYQIWME